MSTVQTKMSGAFVCGGDAGGITGTTSSGKVHSGTRYGTQEEVSNKTSNSGPQDEGNLNDDERNYYREITEQIRLFQGQCSSLKDKLLQVKESRSDPAAEKSNSRKISSKKSSGTNEHVKLSKRSHGHGDYEMKATVESHTDDYQVENVAKNTEPPTVGADCTESAVITINNILHGITNSVNRLSDLKFHVRRDAVATAQEFRPEEPNRKQHQQASHHPVAKRRSKHVSPAPSKDPKARRSFEDASCGPDESTAYSTADKETSRESCTASDFTPSVGMFHRRISPTGSNVAAGGKGKTKKRTSKQHTNPNKCKGKTSSASIDLKKGNKPKSKKGLNALSDKKVKMFTAKDASDDAETQIRKPPKRSRQKQIKQSSKTSVRTKNKTAELIKKGNEKSAEGLIELYLNGAELKESDSEESVRRETERPVRRPEGRNTSQSRRGTAYSSHKDAPQILENVHVVQSQQHYQYQDRGDTSKKSYQQYQNREPTYQQERSHFVAQGQQESQPPRQEYEDNPGARSLSPIEEVEDHQLGSGVHHSMMLSRNYELPTIASKMKQVCKNCLHDFNFQSIPFIASTSTSPSHNLGINIQQVMSIFKTKHPVNGVSPTLVHNLGVAANRLGGRPYSALLSTLGSRLGNRIDRMNCPMNNRMNFSQLQEMAKEIPEEYEADDQNDENCRHSMVYHTAAGGDPNANQRIWQQDDNCKKCTCVPQGGMHIDEVMHKHQQHQLNWNNASYFQNQCYDRRKLSSRNRNRTRSAQVYQRTSSLKPQSSKPCSPSAVSESQANQEKNLKEVLRNLHDEFEKMNIKYDGLEKKSKDGNSKVLQEMEHLEREMTKKEEEIEVVMGLYSEVTNLKKQIRLIRQHESVQRLSYVPSRNIRRAPKSSVHLTKLLRQIQNYQQIHRKLGENVYY